MKNSLPRKHDTKNVVFVLQNKNIIKKTTHFSLMYFDSTPIGNENDKFHVTSVSFISDCNQTTIIS